MIHLYNNEILKLGYSKNPVNKCVDVYV